MFAEASFLYQQFKLVLIDGSGLSKDALHIYAGMGVYLIVRAGLRRPAWMAWGAVVAVALAGEWLDVQGEYIRGLLAPEPGHWHDIWNTAFWPTALALVERWWPRREAAAPEVSGENAERGLEQA
ncbi:hypothetical protein ASD67_08695 [Sphingopyxis sp. Root1497]|uniref:hypothetical protein n=1 Tax=Sphingopyxis sp. Root1497 TaxID=1736474 RepID=UPI0006F5C3E8|nr:hypothetical protein [Sphingopyxis sp. Root1497]KQZ64533.1 hypothetical protein ASD67_08695 [Sphingopyxis sp. Root1497]